MINGYYYLHTNGDLIYKPHHDSVVVDLRDSDFVRAFWAVDTSDRAGAWCILIEALALGAQKSRIYDLAKKWSCSNDDAQVFAERSGIKLGRDGDQWGASRVDFINIAESPIGFGPTCLDAMAELCKQLGFSPTKINWHDTFLDLVKTRLAEEQHEITGRVPDYR